MNLKIIEFKTKLAELINDSGLPIAITQMILESTLTQVGIVVEQVVAKEKAELDKQSEEKEDGAEE